LIGNGAVRVISLFGPKKSIFWRDRLKSSRGNTHRIELTTRARHATTQRGRAHYGGAGEVVEYIFQFIRSSEGELLKFGLVAFSKSENRALARHVIDDSRQKTDAFALTESCQTRVVVADPDSPHRWAQSLSEGERRRDSGQSPPLLHLALVS